MNNRVTVLQVTRLLVQVLIWNSAMPDFIFPLESPSAIPLPPPPAPPAFFAFQVGLGRGQRAIPGDPKWC